MNDKELEEYIRKIEPNFNTHLEKDTIEMNLEYYNMLEERMVRLINKTNNLQFKIDKANELIKRKLSTETYQHLKKLYDDIDSTEEIWEDYEFEDLRDILKEDK